MDEFYPIFKDQQNFRSLKYKDLFPDVPFSNKPSGYNASEKYKQMLEEVILYIRFVCHMLS